MMMRMNCLDRREAVVLMYSGKDMDVYRSTECRTGALRM